MENHKNLSDTKNEKETFMVNNQTIIEEINILSFRFDKLKQNIEILLKTKICESCDNIFKIKDYHKSIKFNDWYCPYCANKIAKIGITEKGLEKTCAKCGSKVILKRISRRKCHIEAISPE